MAYENITLDVSPEGTAVLTLNRPAKRNAFNAPTIEELSDAFETLSKNPECRLLLIRGAGPVSRKILGSVASRLLDSPSGVPVIAVPRHARYHGLHSAVLSSELSQLPAEAAALDNRGVGGLAEIIEVRW